jgi:hypothetical protein
MLSVGWPTVESKSQQERSTECLPMCVDSFHRTGRVSRNAALL